MSPLYGTHGGLGAVSVAERNKEMNQSDVTPRPPHPAYIQNNSQAKI